MGWLFSKRHKKGGNEQSLTSSIIVKTGNEQSLTSSIVPGGSNTAPPTKNRNNRSSNNIDNNSNNQATPMIITYWNTAAGLVVGLPLLLFFVVQLFQAFGEGGGGGEGWFGEWFDAPPEERWQGLGTTLAYLWSVAVFGVLWWRGNRVLTGKKDLRALFVACLMFANLAFLCFLLVTTRGGEAGGGEDEAWMGQFVAVEILTYLFMTVFGVAFCLLLHDKAREDSSSSYTLWGNNDGKNGDNDGIMP